MLIFKRIKAEGAEKSTIICTQDGKELYSTTELALVYSKNESGCTMLKHGEKDLIRDYFHKTAGLMEELAPGLDNNIGYLLAGDSCDMAELTHVINTSAIPEKSFKDLRF